MTSSAWARRNNGGSRHRADPNEADRIEQRCGAGIWRRGSTEMGGSRLELKSVPWARFDRYRFAPAGAYVSNWSQGDRLYGRNVIAVDTHSVGQRRSAGRSQSHQSRGG